MPEKPIPVIVTWRDAHGMYAQWQDLAHPESDADEYLVQTVGWLLKNRKEGHTVVALNLSDYHVADGIAIPNDMIVTVRELTPKRKQSKK
jgi:hypothetical protein